MEIWLSSIDNTGHFKFEYNSYIIGEVFVGIFKSFTVKPGQRRVCTRHDDDTNSHVRYIYYMGVWG